MDLFLLFVHPCRYTPAYNEEDGIGSGGRSARYTSSISRLRAAESESDSKSYRSKYKYRKAPK